MNRLTLINLEWNYYNGFIFEFIHLDLYKPVNIDSSLFGINVSKKFLYIDILFFTIEVFDNTNI